MLPIRALRLQRQAAVTLNRNSFEEGEIVYDATNGTLRLMDGNILGGKQMATQPWTTTAISTAVSASNSALTTAVGLKAPKADPTFTGTVTGTFSGPLTGNVTGNVTGNLTGAVTGNASTATKLFATKTINGVAFDGSSNITINSLEGVWNIGGGATVPISLSLDTSANLILPGGGYAGLFAGATIFGNSTGGSQLSSGQLVANVYAKINGSIELSTNGTGLISGNKSWILDTDGHLTAPGNITTATGIVSASAVTTTNNITVGGNAVISTKPTLPTHATNKKYVDVKAIALAIAMS
jgi:hypothetical protein